jgi:hypothetical protein
MAIRKPTPAKSARNESPAEAEGWPYAVHEVRVTVHADGTLRLPAAFVQMLGRPGEHVTVKVFSDGHGEMDGPDGRSAPAKAEPGSKTYRTTDEFLAALTSDFANG